MTMLTNAAVCCSHNGLGGFQVRYFYRRNCVLEQGLTLTILGMAIVFTFLALLVTVMVVMSGIIRRVENKRRGAAGSKANETETAAEKTETKEAGAERAAVAGEGAPETEAAAAGAASPEVAAAIGACLREGKGREDIAAAIAVIASGGGAVPRERYQEIAAAVAAAWSYKNN